jgi:RNA polymerase sigma factor (sigma-70 family)
MTDAEVAAYIGRWRPSPVSAEAAAFARDVIAKTGPEGRERAKNLLWAAGKLADYAIGLGLDLAPEVVLHPSVAERFTSSLADVLGRDDPQIEHTLDVEAVAAHWSELPRREQKILLLRFYGDKTQAQIGAQLGISQMHVSRLQAHALGHLRERLLGIPAQPAATPRASAPAA